MQQKGDPFLYLWDLLQKESDKYIACADGAGNWYSFQPTNLLKER